MRFNSGLACRAGFAGAEVCASFVRARFSAALTAPTVELDVHDRVGGGDGFASGFFYGLLSGETAEEAVKLGWAHGALLTTYPGDTTMATIAEEIGRAHV